MTAPVTRSPLPHDDSFDARWARWQAAGAAQDRAWNRRATVLGVLGLGALSAWLAIASYLS